MSTISTAAASRLAGEHARLGQSYVAAPVFGNPDAAKARQLFIIAAGVATEIMRCQSIFDNLGERTFVVGTDPQDANLIKLLGNMMSATALEMLGEAVAVLRKRGLDPQPFVDIMTSTMFGGRAHKIYGDKVVRQMYAPGFLLPLVLKDVRLALAEGEKAGAPMPSVGVVRDRLITGIARGHGDLDWSALGLVAAEEAGLHAVPSVTPTEIASIIRAPKNMHQNKEHDHGGSSWSPANEYGTYQHSGHVAQSVAGCDRNLGDRRLDVGRDR